MSARTRASNRQDSPGPTPVSKPARSSAKSLPKSCLNLAKSGNFENWTMQFEFGSRARFRKKKKPGVAERRGLTEYYCSTIASTTEAPVHAVS